jgi:prevent-host-death family protein
LRCEHLFVLSTNEKGAIAETAIAAAATKLGISVLRPIVEHGRYDLAFEIGNRLRRVQCKWGQLDDAGAVVRVALKSNRLTPAGYVQRAYTADEIDLVAIYCAPLDRCYLLPIELVAGRRAIHLRVTPPLNGQRACIQLASSFEFDGAVAQLEERDAGSVEVRGSSPLSSISPSAPEEPNSAAVIQVGSHEFRNHFGHYLERAAAGDQVEIARHGRPYARLVPCSGVPRVGVAV